MLCILLTDVAGLSIFPSKDVNRTDGSSKIISPFFEGTIGFVGKCIQLSIPST